MISAVEIFKALADETRLRIIKLFLASQQSLCVCEIVDALDLPQYQVSKHLILLKNAGVLKSSREGTWVYYWLNREGSPLLQDLFQVLSRHLHQEVFEGDAHRLELRLLLREEGACVVGFVSERELKKRIREKGIEVG